MKIAPSMLSADFSKLKEEIVKITEAGADYIHLDIMDGHFVPNITFGPDVIKSIRPFTTLPFDVHLMIEHPDQYIQQFVLSGADIITVHVEACTHLHRTLQLIKSYNVKAGVVVNPHTPIEMIELVLDLCDIVLVMSVNPGFGGQSFIHSSLEKIKKLRELKEKFNYSYEIEVDGGVNAETAKLCLEAGADVLVAGSYVFKSRNRKEAIELIRG